MLDFWKLSPESALMQGVLIQSLHLRLWRARRLLCANMLPLLAWIANLFALFGRAMGRPTRERAHIGKNTLFGPCQKSDRGAAPRNSGRSSSRGTFASCFFMHLDQDPQIYFSQFWIIPGFGAAEQAAGHNPKNLSKATLASNFWLLASQRLFLLTLQKHCKTDMRNWSVFKVIFRLARVSCGRGPARRRHKAYKIETTKRCREEDDA